MPPKPKFTKDEILDAAREVVRESGEDAVTARAVASRLGCTGSSLFTHFASMDEIRLELVLREGEKLAADLKGSLAYFPAFKEFGMRLYRYSQKEPNLFCMLFRGKDGRVSVAPRLRRMCPQLLRTFERENGQHFGLNRPQAEHMVASMLVVMDGVIARSPAPEAMTPDNDKQMGQIMSEICIGLVLLAKAQNGSLDPELAGRMAADVQSMPVPLEKADDSRRLFALTKIPESRSKSL